MVRDAKILAMIIDDNTERRKRLRGRLRKHGCRIVGFSGENNPEDIKRALPDIVFLSYETIDNLSYKAEDVLSGSPALVYYGNSEELNKKQLNGKTISESFTDRQLKEAVNSLSHPSVAKSRKMEKIVDVQLELIEEMKGLSKVSGSKYPEKIQQLCLILLEGLSQNPIYKKKITPTYKKAFIFAATLHDIGMIGIDMSIINKAEPLSHDEFEIIKAHTESGNKIISLAKKVKTSKSYLEMSEQIIRSHHERWDGKGYPDGLKGEDIPLCARIMAVADAYDALRQERSYRPRKNHDQAKIIIMEESGSQFDPEIVKAFLLKEKKIYLLYESMAYQIIK